MVSASHVFLSAETWLSPVHDLTSQLPSLQATASTFELGILRSLQFIVG